LYRYARGQTDESVRKAVHEQLPVIKDWAKKYLAESPQAQAPQIDLHSKKYRVSISKALEIEEHVWSLMYGLKGSIDVSVEAVFEAERRLRNLELPLELKSGKRSVIHAAQVIIYSLLMADRYGSFHVETFPTPFFRINLIIDIHTVDRSRYQGGAVILNQGKANDGSNHRSPTSRPHIGPTQQVDELRREG
jgi:hypothetical protein